MKLLSPLPFSLQAHQRNCHNSGINVREDRIHIFTNYFRLSGGIYVATIQVNLISGRSVQQGVAIEGGKEKPAYRTAAGIIELDPIGFKETRCMEEHQCQGNQRFRQRYRESNRDYTGTTPRARVHSYGTLGKFNYQPEYVLNGYADIQGCHRSKSMLR